MRSRTLSRYAAGLLALGLTVSLGACSQDPGSVAAQAKAGDQKGYVSGDGTVEAIAPASRKEPVVLTGPTIDGGSFDLASVRGSVVVVNKWGSWCPPCVAELPELQKLWTAYEKGGKVRFLGIDVRESAANGLAQARKVGLTYPSLTDESGLLELQLQGQALATPTTLVLDRQGRIAARVSGRTTEATLRGLVDDVLAEP